MTPIDFNDPSMNTYYDPYNGLSDNTRMKATCFQLFGVAAVIITLLLCLLSCTTTKDVPIVQQHTERHWHTDTVRERDSIHTQNSTIIRELDSAAMAQYGIRLQNAERAWLVQSQELQSRLRELVRMTATSDTIHDSIPCPYPVEVIKEVPAELTWCQQARLYMANILLYVLLGGGIVWIVNKKLTRI